MPPPRSAGPRNTGVAAPVRCPVHQPAPKTKMSCPDSDRSAMRRSSSLAGSPVSVILIMPRSSPRPVPLLVGNSAPPTIDTRLPARWPARKVGLFCSLMNFRHQRHAGDGSDPEKSRSDRTSSSRSVLEADPQACAQCRQSGRESGGPRPNEILAPPAAVPRAQIDALGLVLLAFGPAWP